MTGRPDWLLPWFPELRAGPPWVTEEMILAQAGLARLVESLAVPATAVARAVTRAAGERAPVVVAGSGTAECAAIAVAELLDDVLGRRGGDGGKVEAREALDAALDPRRRGVFIGVSHGGRSRSTVAALNAARSAEAVTVLITADAEAPAAGASDLVLVTPLRDRSFCHTVAYVSPILAAGAVAAAIAGSRLDAAAIEAHLAAALAVRPSATATGARLRGVRNLLAVGGGCDAAAARELALKIEEAARVPAANRGLETVLHGHLVAANGMTGLVLFVTDPRSRERRAERGEYVLRAARRIGLETAVIATPDAAERFGPELETAGAIVVPESDAVPGVLSSLLATALALQLLTIGLVHELGVNPDLIRREEAAYREAAELAETKIR